MTTGVDRVFLVPSGYNFRAVLAFCRALRKAGLSPAILACTAADPIFRTRYSGDVVFTRADKTLRVADFSAATAAALARTRAKRCVLAPTAEYLVRWALQNRQALEIAGCDLPLPDESAYFCVTEKAAFAQLCKSQGLPIPNELPIASEANLPCVAKPRWNVSPSGRSLSPRLLRTKSDLAAFAVEERIEDFFIQEWVEGTSFYLLFHLPKNGPAVISSQQNIAQQFGGKSIVLARSATLHLGPEAAKWERALRTARFHGLVMVEVRQRGDEYVLIEANPRLWGPLQLCVDACPRLLMSYIAEFSEVLSPLAKKGFQDRAATYTWIGGVGTGMVDWHQARPSFPRLSLWRHLYADVYFQRDSWRQFFHELSRSPKAVAQTVPDRSTLVPAA
ncbi:MAG: hypothetical protein ABIP96_03255 [Patescibacteria group bacterium]